MTTDPFIEAARAEAERRWPMDALPVRLLSAAERKDRRIGFEVGARWARTHLTATLTANDSQSDSEPTSAHLAAQEPTDAEVEAAARVIWRESTGRSRWESVSAERRAVYLDMARAALSAARAARRDEEKRDG